MTLLFSERKREFTCAQFHLLNALLEEICRVVNNFVSFFFLYIVSPPRCSTNLRLLPEFINVLVRPHRTLFYDSKELICALLASFTEFPIPCCVILAQPKEHIKT
jgi:hypothetical protein